MDYSAVGQTTHLAARMEQLATPGTIRLTPVTVRLVEGLVQVNALGPIPVKGLIEPAEVFELVGATAVRQRFQARAAQGLTRFVGRQRELDALRQTLEQAGAGHGQVVVLVGEAGVGKSRLVYEFAHSHRAQGWRVLESASVGGVPGACGYYFGTSPKPSVPSDPAGSKPSKAIFNLSLVPVGLSLYALSPFIPRIFHPYPALDRLHLGPRWHAIA
jgi:hypothetical protein